MTPEKHLSEGTTLSDYWRITWHGRKFLLLITAVVVAGTLLASLFLPNIYEAKAVLVPVVGGAKDQSAASLIALQFGVSAPSSPAAAEITNLLKSNILAEKIVRKYKLVPVFFTERFITGKPEERLLWEGIRYLKKMMSINFVQRDNIVQISVQFKNPEKAAEIASYAIFELNEHMSSEAKRVAETNRKYLESQIDKAADPFIRTKIYGLIAQQIETAMMAEAKENFAFKILDPPKAPDKKIKPVRSYMALLALVAGLFLAVFVVLLKDYRARSIGGAAAFSGN